MNPITTVLIAEAFVAVVIILGAAVTLNGGHIVLALGVLGQ